LDYGRAIPTVTANVHAGSKPTDLEGKVRRYEAAMVGGVDVGWTVHDRAL